MTRTSARSRRTAGSVGSSWARRAFTLSRPRSSSGMGGGRPGLEGLGLAEVAERDGDARSLAQDLERGAGGALEEPVEELLRRLAVAALEPSLGDRGGHGGERRVEARVLLVHAGDAVLARGAEVALRRERLRAVVVEEGPHVGRRRAGEPLVHLGDDAVEVVLGAEAG